MKQQKQVPAIWQVIKLSGGVEVYDEAKVVDAIFLAAQEAGGTDEAIAQNLGKTVTAYLQKQYGRVKEISTRDINDAVERVLMEQHHLATAKIYILNRDKKREEWEAKIRLGITDDIGMSLNTLLVMKNKYLQVKPGKKAGSDERETPKEAFERVATALAGAEPTATLKREWHDKFLQVMVERRMFPAGRTLANAGTINNQLANCFVMPFPDDIEGIFEVVKESSILKKNGGGVGFSFSQVRPKGDVIRTTSGAAAGPVALMGILDHASEIFTQAGGRRSGNMVTLSVSHPDIFEFISCKDAGTNLPNINYSLEAGAAFMKAVAADKEWTLINPHSGETVQTVAAKSLLEAAARQAWRGGDPGMIFIDEINTYNPTPHVGRLETVNLCGEQPLLPYEACNLGSVNLAAHLIAKKGRLSTIGDYEWDFPKLIESVRTGIRMLDDVIEVGTYPLKKIDQTVKANRKIGLGVMGWADALIRLGVPYNSAAAIAMAEKIMKLITDTAWEESGRIAAEKGSFPNFKGSIWEKRGYRRFRNATTTTIAPTGSLSLVAGVSSGIEPVFALAYYRKAMGNFELPELNTDLLLALKRVNGAYSAGLVDTIAKQGTIQNASDIPEKIRSVFVTAMDVAPADHVLMQAAFQKHTDNAVSKTINLPKDAGVEEIIEIFTLAYEKKCKGITVYRDKSREVQVLNVGKKSGVTPAAAKAAPAGNEEKCPNCGGKVMMVEGCATCMECGWGKCSV